MLHSGDFYVANTRALGSLFTELRLLSSLFVQRCKYLQNDPNSPARPYIAHASATRCWILFFTEKCLHQQCDITHISTSRIQHRDAWPIYFKGKFPYYFYGSMEWGGKARECQGRISLQQNPASESWGYK